MTAGKFVPTSSSVARSCRKPTGGLAAARLGLQQTPIRTERPAESSCMNLQRVFHDNGARPDAVHQLVLGDKFAGRLGQNFDDLEGAPTNRYGRSKDPKLAA